MTATRKDLLEFVQQTQVRVDREKRMIYGLKLLGRSSGNRHGLNDITGTDYLQEACDSAVSLYEGKAGYMNHPDRKTPSAERSVLDKILIYRNVRPGREGIYGDAEYLDAHPFTPILLEAVERSPHWLTLSHNAVGEGSVKNGKYVVHRILEVRSVDIVSQGATTKTLFESQEQTMHLRDRLKGLGVPAKKLQLLEQNYPDLKPAIGEAEGEQEAKPVTWKSLIMQAITLLSEDESIQDGEDKKQMILQLVDIANGHAPQPEMPAVPPLAGDAPPMEGMSDVPPPDGDDDENGNGLDDTEEFAPDDEEEDPMKKITKESAEWKEFQQFQREKAVKSLCESHKFEPTKSQLAILVDLRESRRPEAIAEFKAASKGKSGPRSTGRDTLESAEPLSAVPGKVEDFVKSITR